MRWQDLPEAVQEEMLRRLGQKWRNAILLMVKQAQQYLSPAQALDLIDKQVQDLRRISRSEPRKRDGGSEDCPHTTMSKVKYKPNAWICTTEGFPQCHKEIRA